MTDGHPATFDVPLSVPFPPKSMSCVKVPLPVRRMGAMRVAMGSLPRGSRM